MYVLVSTPKSAGLMLLCFGLCMDVLCLLICFAQSKIARVTLFSLLLACWCTTKFPNE